MVYLDMLTHRQVITFHCTRYVQKMGNYFGQTEAGMVYNTDCCQQRYSPLSVLNRDFKMSISIVQGVPIVFCNKKPFSPCFVCCYVLLIKLNQTLTTLT